MGKSIEYFMQLPYKVDIYPEEDGTGYTATIPELPGCMTAADSIEELWESLSEAKRLWLELAIEEGDHIPEPAPADEEEYSGKFVARLPRSLHRELATRADRENTSLNQLVVMLLSDSMGRWHETGDLRTGYARLLAKYQDASVREFGGLYTMVIRAMHEAPARPTSFDWTWPTEGWRIHRQDSVRALG